MSKGSGRQPQDFEAQAEDSLASFMTERDRAEALIEQLGADVPYFKLKSAVRQIAEDHAWPLTAALLRIAERSEDPSRTVKLARLALMTANRLQLPERAKLTLLTEAEALLGDGWRRRGNLRDAERAFERAVRHLDRAVDPYLCALYCCLLAKLREAQGKTEEALALLQRASALFAEIGQVDGQADALLDKALLELRREEEGSASADLRVVIGLMDKGLSPDLAAIAIAAYGTLLKEPRRGTEALLLLGLFWDRYPDFASPTERAELALLEGTLLMFSDRRAVAEAKLQAARREFFLSGDLQPAAKASLSLAVVLLLDSGRESDLKRLAKESLLPLAGDLSMPEPARVALLGFCAAIESGTATPGEARDLLEVVSFMLEDVATADRKGKER